jgi:hypothetical protein
MNLFTYLLTNAVPAKLTKALGIITRFSPSTYSVELSEKKSYPYSYFTFSGISPQNTEVEGYAIKRLYRQNNVRVGTNAEGTVATHIPLIPVTVSMEYHFVGDSFKDLTDFLVNWYVAYATGALSFVVKYKGLEIDTTLRLATELNPPQKELVPLNAPNYYDVFGQFSVNTFIDKPEDHAVRVFDSDSKIRIWLEENNEDTGILLMEKSV